VETDAPASAVQRTVTGELSEDEEQLAKTPVKQNFFEHLAESQDLGQFIVLENVNLPTNIRDLARVEIFVGDAPGGRPGFFPAAQAQPASSGPLPR
jgi:hypothetical protein